MRWSLWVILIGVVGFALWVRLAPSDPARFHVGLDHEADATGKGDARRVVPGGAAQLEALDVIILATPRTRVIAGSVAEGRITYETRSALWGFPDYTTVQSNEEDLLLWGRLRYGAADLGVNAARLDGWLERLGER